MCIHLPDCSFSPHSDVAEIRNCRTGSPFLVLAWCWMLPAGRDWWAGSVVVGDVWWSPRVGCNPKGCRGGEQKPPQARLEDHEPLHSSSYIDMWTERVIHTSTNKTTVSWFDPPSSLWNYRPLHGCTFLWNYVNVHKLKPYALAHNIFCLLQNVRT